jgi:transposase
MAGFRLTSRACARLRHIVRNGSRAREIKRAQALLWLHQGRRICDVATELRMHRRTIERWIRHYQDRAEVPVAERIQEGRHTGRPPTALNVARRVIAQVWERDPRRYGFRALVWTVPMLRCLIQRRTKRWLGQATVRRALRSLRHRYKRPRLVLARRSPTWRQAKGGLNAA